MRTVLITGGSRGIGAAIARRFASAGERVIFTYKDLRNTAETLASAIGAEAMRMNVADGISVRNGVDAILQRYGSIDVLVNNAGVGLNRLLIDTEDEAYRRVMDVNVYGPFCVMRAVLPGMIERRSGAVVNISSIWGQTGGANEAVYSASKAAVIGITRVVAKEVASAGIRVNCVAPGFIETDMNRGLSQDDLEMICREIPMNRAGTAEEVAEAVFFLSGSRASYITGQVLSVNGGWLLG